jgi:hypothetical protein
MGVQTPPGLSDEKASRMLVGLRAGRTPRSLYVAVTALTAYCNAHPEYGREALPLIEANAKAAHLRKGAHIRNKTHCINGHSFAEHGRVAMHKGWKTRQCRACEVMRYHQGGIITPEVLQKVTARIISGSPINSFTKGGSDNYLVKFSTLARYRRENVEFDRLVTDAISDRVYRAAPRSPWAPLVTNGIRLIFAQYRRCCRTIFQERTTSFSRYFLRWLRGASIVAKSSGICGAS